MSAPTAFPVWMQAPAGSGQPDTLVQDLNSYNAALANGYTYNAGQTPEQNLEVLGNDQGTDQVAELPAGSDPQVDPLQPIDPEE